MKMQLAMEAERLWLVAYRSETYRIILWRISQKENQHSHMNNSGEEKLFRRQKSQTDPDWPVVFYRSTSNPLDLDDWEPWVFIHMFQWANWDVAAEGFGLFEQFTGPLPAPQVPVSVWGGACSAAQQPAGESPGLQDHHPRRESRTQNELHRQCAGTSEQFDLCF